MIFAVKFEDNAEYEHMRSRYMQDHLAFLESHADKILSAGPLTEISQNIPGGGLWIVDAQNAEVVEDLVEADPFRHTGLRKTITVYQWNRVFFDGIRKT